MAYYQAAGGDFGSFQEERAGGYDAAGADAHAVQNDRHPSRCEAARFDGAAVQGDGVADGDVVAEDERVLVAHDVEDAAVLNVGAGADADVVDVAADYGAGPDAGVFADDYVADDDGGGVDIGGRRRFAGACHGRGGCGAGGRALASRARGWGWDFD